MDCEHAVDFSETEWSKELSIFWNWLDSLHNIKSLPICKKNIDLTCEAEISKFKDNKIPLVGPDKCSELTNVMVRVTKNKKGVAERVEKVNYLKFSSIKKCYKMLPTINKISGSFKNGSFHGKANIFYNDETKMKVTFDHGVINGNVLIFNKHEDLQVHIYLMHQSLKAYVFMKPTKKS